MARPRKPKLGRPRGSRVRADLDAATARLWWSLDVTTGRLTWLRSPGGSKRAGDVIGDTVTLAGQRYRANRLAVLLATGSWPAAGRVPRKVLAAVRGERVAYSLPSPRKGIPAAQWRRLGI
ncbi:MAG: hypothetical protein KGL52_01145 [Rhodospirillales bacterium]|nr:hypothetical protein [Rhodospirillales bacterium]